VTTVKFNSDGAYCMSGGVDKLCKLWNPHTGRLIKVYKAHAYAISDLCISSDNAAFASGGLDKAVFLWDVTQDAPTRRLRGHTEAVNCVTFCAGNGVLASGSYDGTLRLWDIKSRAVVPLMTLAGFKDSVTAVHAVDFSIVTGCVDGYVRTFDIRMGKELVECVLRPITHVQVSADRNCLLVQTLDNTVRLLDRKSGALLNEFTAHKNAQYKVGACLSHRDRWLVSGSEDAGVYVYDVLNGAVVAHLTGHRGCTTAVQYHPTLAAMISAATDGTLRLWTADVGG